MSDVVGSWVMITDWGCDGTISGSWNHTFNADGTWTSSLSYSGKWFQVEGLIVFTIDTAPDLIYTANVSGSWMAGVQAHVVYGTRGCFGAHRLGAAVAPPADKPTGIDPVTGR